MSETTAIVLAAGLSRRMGALNKLLLPVDGVPMIRHVARQYRAAIDGEVLVVLGHEADDVASALAGTGVETVFNPRFEEGQPTSVEVGLRHVGDAQTLLIGLGDQPLLTARDLTALLTAHYCAKPDKISIPVHGDMRGNPLVVPRHLRAELLADPKNPGCRKFTRAHPEWVQELPLTPRGLFVDIDTPSAYDTHFPVTKGAAA